jgi:hypothetical protein
MNKILKTLFLGVVGISSITSANAHVSESHGSWVSEKALMSWVKEPEFPPKIDPTCSFDKIGRIPYQLEFDEVGNSYGPFWGFKESHFPHVIELNAVKVTGLKLDFDRHLTRRNPHRHIEHRSHGELVNLWGASLAFHTSWKPSENGDHHFYSEDANWSLDLKRFRAFKRLEAPVTGKFYMPLISAKLWVGENYVHLEGDEVEWFATITCYSD